MKPPPRTLDGATVLRVADVTRKNPTGNTHHVVDGEDSPAMAGLAIAKFESGPGYYLFYCDDNWNVITDTYHETMEHAEAQAEFEFGTLTFSTPSH